MTQQPKKALYLELEAKLDRAYDLALAIVDHAKTKTMKKVA